MGVLGVLLFFGAMTMPTLIGVMISSVPKELKYMASSFGALFYTVIGYLPAPVLYSLVCRLTGGNNSPYGMMFVLYTGTLGLLSVYITYNYKRKQGI